MIVSKGDSTAKFSKIVTVNIEEGALDKRYWERLDKLTEKRIDLPRDSPQIKKELTDADCMLVGFGVKTDKTIIDSAPKLKYIGVLATAYDFVDFDYAKRKGIPVTNVPGYSTESVAEFAFAAILEQIREISKGKIEGRKGNYDFAGFTATEIRGKIFGVFGLGRIGTRIAEIAQGFGADVRYWSRTRKPELEKKGIKYEEADALLSKCDFVSLNFALTQETAKFLNVLRLKKLKRNAIVINLAPTELVDVDALEERLKAGDLYYILDHSDDTPADQMKRLSKYKNCIIYPPIAFVSAEARIAKEDIFLGNIVAFLNGKSQNEVN